MKITKKKVIWGVIILFVFIILASGDDKKDNSPESSSAPTKSPLTATKAPTTNPISKGNRLLSIDISKHDDYQKAFNEAKASGLQLVQISLAWDDMDKSGTLEDPWGLLGIANGFYPTTNTSLILSVGPIDTNNNRIPDDLSGKNLDDPEVIERYKKVIDFVFNKTSNSKINSFAIGNEIDVYLGSNNSKWQQYINFFNEVSAYARSKKSGVKVGSKTTFKGVTGYSVEQIKNLNQNSDAVFVTYYGIKDDFKVKSPEEVYSDLKKIVDLYPGKEIQFLEMGYPSSSVLNSSEEKQAEFVKKVFEFWDQYRNQVSLINFVWSHDISQSKLNEYSKYYGSSNKNFIAYLATLGLKTNDDKAKQAWGVLKTEAKARGW